MGRDTLGLKLMYWIEVERLPVLGIPDRGILTESPVGWYVHQVREEHGVRMKEGLDYSMALKLFNTLTVSPPSSVKSTRSLDNSGPR